MHIFKCWFSLALIFFMWLHNIAIIIRTDGGKLKVAQSLLCVCALFQLSLKPPPTLSNKLHFNTFTGFFCVLMAFFVFIEYFFLEIVHGKNTIMVHKSSLAVLSFFSLSPSHRKELYLSTRNMTSPSAVAVQIVWYLSSNVSF